MARFDDEDEQKGGDSRGSGGQGGAIEFTDFIFPAERKLTAAEEKQKLAEHKEINSQLVEEQKDEREKRLDPTQGKGAGYQLGASNSSSDFEAHPILSQVAEFDGVDPQMNADPNKNETKKNQELTLQHQKRLDLQNQPSFVPPTPRPGG